MESLPVSLGKRNKQAEKGAGDKESTKGSKDSKERGRDGANHGTAYGESDLEHR